MKNILELHKKNIAVVDMDSGTVLGNNLLAIPWPEDEELQEEILSSDSFAFEYAREHGQVLFIEE